MNRIDVLMDCIYRNSDRPLTDTIEVQYTVNVEFSF